MRHGKISAGTVVRRLETPAREPATTVERFAAEILQRAGCLPLARLVEQIADALYRQELRYASVLDLGFVGAKVFASGVMREVMSAAGALWTVVEQTSDQTAAAVREHKHG